MLSSVFWHRGVDPSLNQDMSDLLQSSDTATQEEVGVVSWNLEVVFKWLSGPCFEPLRSISLMDLTRKHLFW